MNIVFSTYPNAFVTPGGGEIQLLQYLRHLEERGVSVSRFDLWRGFEQFDGSSVMHFFSCMPGSEHFLRFCSDKGFPVVVSPNLWVTEDTAHLYPFNEIRAVLDVADAVVCNSDAECVLLSRVFGLPRERFFTVYNAVDQMFLEPVDPALFREAAGISGKFVLNVANIESRKNQLVLIRAMKHFPDLTLVVAGHVRDQSYADQCAAEGGAQWRHVGSLPYASDLLRSAYSGCEVFALPSTLETPGLAALEAAACGCRIVLTREGSTSEYFGNDVFYVDPMDGDSIARAIRQALDASPGALRSRISSHFLWPQVMNALTPVYDAARSLKAEKDGFFRAQGMRGSNFNAIERDADGLFVWSQARSSVSAPVGLLAWRWWALREIEVDLLLNNVPVRGAIRVGPSWSQFSLDIPATLSGDEHDLEIRVRGDVPKQGDRELGVMLRDLVHLGVVGQPDGRREQWCLSRGLILEACGAQGEAFFPAECDERGYFVWSQSEFRLLLRSGQVRLEGFVAQKSRVTFLCEKGGKVAHEVELDVGESRLEFDAPGDCGGQTVALLGRVEKLEGSTHSDPRDLGLAIRAIRLGR
ncbi:glycosyltransferase [Aromatoleum toluclasticum]|uniref:glycosyltransferase n=1 Tax=Aromatoleum toluclasticum TaxID=92003 RepID=UPI001D1984E0|nr:glycosyltransferase [Aromatoleum toluclasticum]MCC4117952.1 glycosyltransferase [Aromatoleum toluclasticum]